MGGKTKGICRAMDLYTGIDLKRTRQDAYQVKLKEADKRAYNRSANLESLDNKVNTDKELVNFWLYTSNISAIDQSKAFCIENMSLKDKALEKIYILQDLKRVDPDRSNQYGNYYDYKINKVKENTDLSNAEINNYIQSRHIETLQEYTKDNKHFTYYQKRTNKVDQDMNKVLKYLLEPTEGNKKALLELTKRITKKASGKDSKSPEYKKYYEYWGLMDQYKDLKEMTTDILWSRSD